MSTDNSTRIANVQTLSDALNALPFPMMGKAVGDFGLYDSLLAGVASSVLASADLPPNGVPVPDLEPWRRSTVYVAEPFQSMSASSCATSNFSTRCVRRSSRSRHAKRTKSSFRCVPRFESLARLAILGASSLAVRADFSGGRVS